MPRISKRKQLKPRHTNSKESSPDSKTVRQATKDLVADNNGNIITPRKTRNRAQIVERNTSSKETIQLLMNSNDAEDSQVNEEEKFEKSNLNDSDFESDESNIKDLNTSNVEENQEPSYNAGNDTGIVTDESLETPEQTKMAVADEDKSKSPERDEQAKGDVTDDDISDGASYDPESEDEVNRDDLQTSDSSSHKLSSAEKYSSFGQDDNGQKKSPYSVETETSKCEFCGVRKNSASDLERHLKKHWGERPFLCLLCNRAFKAKRSLQYHQFSVHGIEHKSISERYPDIRKRKLAAGELLDESVIQELDKKRQKFEEENGIETENTSIVESSPPFLINGIVVESSKRRVCEICKKVCMKPSDLKRHMMSHTGERPFKCEVCGKPFRAKNSMMYHLKSAHGYMVELSPGLEERFLKLKKQNKLHFMMGMQNNQRLHPSPQKQTPKLSPQSLHSPKLTPAPPETVVHSSHRDQSKDSHQKKLYYSCDSNSFTENEVELDELSGLFKQKDIDFEAVNHKIFKPQPVALPPTLVKPGGNLIGKEIHQEFNSGTCDIKVRSETVLVTRIDGIMSSQDVCAYKCYLCGKLFNYLSKVQFHLSFHFEREIKTYHCKLCKSSYPFKYQMFKHIHKSHSSALNKTDKPTSVTNQNLKGDSHSMSDLFSVLRFKRKENGSYACMICKKSFHLEGSLLKHIKSHSNHIFCYCRVCGNGFTTYKNLQEHFKCKHTTVKPANHVGDEILTKEPSMPEEQLLDLSMKADTNRNSLLSHLLRKTSQCGKIDKTIPQKKCQMSNFTEIEPDIEFGEQRAVEYEIEKKFEEEKAKELLEKEGIEDDITVVMPCDPEDEVSKVEETNTRSWPQPPKDTVEEKLSAEIQPSPNVSLLPKVGNKSKRKASQPVRINHKKDEDTSKTGLDHIVESAQAEQEPSLEVDKSRDDDSVKQKTKDELSQSAVSTPPVTSVPSSSSDLTSADDKKLPSALPASGLWPHIMPPPHFPPSLMPTGQLLQAMAATGHGTNAMSLAQALASPTAQALIASGQFSSVAQALVNAGHLPASLAHTFTTQSTPPLFMPQSLTPPASFMPLTQMFAMQAAAALHQSKVNNNIKSPIIKPEENDKSERESQEGDDSSHSTIEEKPTTSLTVDIQDNGSPSPSSSGNMSESSPHEESQDNMREKLVGMPKVQWSPDENPFNWHHMSSDGRKVTSLSRTHSRLPIVNCPVNRDQICKPTTLDDGRQVFSCPFCSKNFSSYSDINRHMDFHEDIRPYKCKYCEYYARTNSQLKVHMMRHQGIREFCCKVCNYKGVTQSDLNRHMKSQIHMLKSRNECSYCGEGFVTSKNLEKHLDGNCIVKVQQEKGEYLVY